MTDASKPGSEGRVSITCGIPGDLQQSSFQNATLSVYHPKAGPFAWRGVAVSVAIRPIIPESILEQGEAAIAQHLSAVMGLISQFAEVEIEIGSDRE